MCQHKNLSSHVESAEFHKPDPIPTIGFPVDMIDTTVRIFCEDCGEIWESKHHTAKRVRSIRETLQTG